MLLLHRTAEQRSPASQGQKISCSLLQHQLFITAVIKLFRETVRVPQKPRCQTVRRPEQLALRPAGLLCAVCGALKLPLTPPRRAVLGWPGC
jgi:hypothetical protein